jgi:hypothetical protein
MMDAPSCPDCPDFGRDRVVKAPSAERFVVQKVLAPLHPQGGRLPGDRRRDPEWMLEHGASADRYLETTGRSISEYVVDEVDDSSSRPFVADALSWCSTNQPARTRLPAPRWRVVHWTAGGGRLVPGSRVAWVRSRPRATGMWGAVA